MRTSRGRARRTLRARRSALLALLAFLPFACAGEDAPPLPAVPIAQVVTVGAREVALGEGFALTIERVWPRDHDADPWPELGTDSVRLHLLDEERREAEGRIRHVRRYRAHAFAPGVLTIAPAPFRARSRATGAVLEVRGESSNVTVVARLAAGDDSAVEFPDGPWEARDAPAWWPAAIAVLGGLLGVVLVRRWRHAAPAEPDAPHAAELAAPAVGDEAYAAELDALRARPCVEREACEQVFRAAAEVLRRHAHERFDVRVWERTSEELVADLRRDPRGAPRAGLLEEALRACDRVKFARAHPGAEQRGRFFRGALAYVRGTPAAAAEEEAR